MSTSLPPAFQRIVTILLANRVNLITAYGLYYWDMIALFPLEYKYVWRSRTTSIKVFYLLNRYVTLVIGWANAYLTMNHIPLSVCAKMTMTQPLFSTTVVAYVRSRILEAVMKTHRRTATMSGSALASRRFEYTLFGIVTSGYSLVCCITMMIYFSTQQQELLLPVFLTDVAGFTNCLSTRTDSRQFYEILLWTPPLTFDALILFLTIFRYFLLRRKTGGTEIPIMRKIVNIHILYFALIASMNAINVGFFAQSDPTLRPSNAVMTLTLTSMMSSRLVLALLAPTPPPAPSSSQVATQIRSLATVTSPHNPSQVGASSTSATRPRKPLFSKILIANRGEIAVRIIRTCRKLGIKTVAVFSEADRHAMHVKMADEAYLLGPAPSHLSYLNIPRLLEVCHESGAQAVHPGYGFMSENADFARKLEQEGIVFIGPGVDAIVSMGSKAESKDIMKAADVPCIPGWHPSTTGNTPSDPSVDTQSPDFLIVEADKIGYPVLIKAVSGGGGKGMKIVENREEFASQLESAKREGRKSFGDDTVLLEKYVTKPRHVEVQIFSDSHGNHLSLFERDCSVQRRHQKVIEEAPAPNLSQEVRNKLYETARKAAKAVGYRGAGTVEFVLNADKPDEFFFLEVNTRLQVEHPVTEAITGVDLVEWQLEVAAGNQIPLKQEEVACTGHAFEVRVYAENPRNNFLPDTGTLLHVKTPKESEYVRLETGFEAGDEISVFYDPLIAKLIVHGPNRREALKRLRKALGEYQIVGPSTNLEFLTRLAENEAFADEDLDTGFIPVRRVPITRVFWSELTLVLSSRTQRHYDTLFPALPTPSGSTLASSALFLADREISQYTSSHASSSWNSPQLAGFRLGGTEGNRYRRTYETAQGKLSVSPSIAGSAPGQPGFDVTFTPNEGAGNPATLLDASPTFLSSTGTSTTVSTLLSSQLSRVDIVSSTPTISQALESGVAENLHVFNESESFAGTIEVKQPSWMKDVASKRGGVAGGKGGGARAPMPSKIVEVKVKAGDRVEAGQQLVVVEAMKMEHVLKASKAGVVEKVTAQEGDLVKEGQLLVVFVAEAGDEAQLLLARPRPLGLVPDRASSLPPRLLQHATAPRHYSTTPEAAHFLKENASNDPDDCFYPWKGLIAFKEAYTKKRQERDTILRNLDISTIAALPIRSQKKSLFVFYPPGPIPSEPESFLLRHDQVVRLENTMVNQGNVPRDEIEQAWKAAGRPLVRQSQLHGKMRKMSYPHGEKVDSFVEAQQKKLEEQRNAVQEAGWEPTVWEGCSPNAWVSLKTIETFCKSGRHGDLRSFLRRIVKARGPARPIPVVKAKPLQKQQERAQDVSETIYVPSRQVQAAVEAIARDQSPRSDVPSLEPVLLHEQGHVTAFSAHGLSDLEHTLAHLGLPLPEESPSIDAVIRSGPMGRSVDGSRDENTSFASWTDIRSALERYQRGFPQEGKTWYSTPRTPLRFLQYLFDVSPGGASTFVEAKVVVRASRPASASPAPSSDLFLPHSVAQNILRKQGVVAHTKTAADIREKIAKKLRRYTLDQLEERRSVELQSVTQFEKCMRSLRDPSSWTQSLPWTEGAEVEVPKGTKRNAVLIERTKAQLLTPAPSVESTPEPVPPPLKRAKSSQLVPTVSALSLSTPPSTTPATSPALHSPAPSALIPASSATATAGETIADAKVAASKLFELETLRHAYETAQREGGASFLALDVEFWERDHEVLTEFGWTLVEFVRHQNGKVTERREDQHAVIKENQRFRNGRFSPDARDHFDFGRTLVLPSKALYFLLHALFSTLSATHPLFLVFHDPRGDIRALTKLGFDSANEFERDLTRFGQKREGGGIWVVDTQRIFSAWLGRKSQIGLEKACIEVEIPTKRLHNAGNDAHYTLALLERMMDRSLQPAAESALIKQLDERAAAAKQFKLASAAKREQEEQAALNRK
ncbi:hypothetical protein JCM11491_003945 [Sporobolomyces phaffii]